LASHAAIAAVSRTLRTLLLDRLVTTAPPLSATVTLAPPDVELAGIGARVNLYLMQAIENAFLKNQEVPDQGHPGTYGHPPLSLDLRYLVTTHSASEDGEDADLNAQTILGDAMRVLNDFGNRIDQLTIVNPAAGIPGYPILDPDLAAEFERLKIVLHPATLDDITKVWSAVSGTNFRRSVVYEVTAVQIETPAVRPRPQPVETRRIFVTVRRRPEIIDAYVSPVAPNDPIGETRVRIGEEITILSQRTPADRLYVKLGSLEPIRLSPTGDGPIRIVVPDALYPADLDHPLPRPIPPAEQLQAGPLELRLIAMHSAEGVAGGLGKGSGVAGMRSYASNIWLMQLSPRLSNVSPTSGNESAILQVTGERLWHAGARSVEVIIGDAAITVEVPGVGDPWAAPTATAVEVPLHGIGEILEISPTAYPVAVQVDGARSRDPGFAFTLGP
jgi:hypothetical protein